MGSVEPCHGVLGTSSDVATKCKPAECCVPATLPELLSNASHAHRQDGEPSECGVGGWEEGGRGRP